MAEELEEIIASLEQLSERLSDLGIEALRQAVEDGATSRPEFERQTSRARAAIERAIAILTRQAREESENASEDAAN